MDKQLQCGIRLFNDEEFFTATKCSKRPGRRSTNRAGYFCKAVIHLAVGLYHCQLGNPIGASRQLHKGLKKLAKYLPACDGIDTSRLYQEALAALAQIEAGVSLSAYPKIQTSPAASTQP
jgi:uncharacterized protein